MFCFSAGLDFGSDFAGDVLFAEGEFWDLMRIGKIRVGDEIRHGRRDVEQVGGYGGCHDDGVGFWGWVVWG